MILQLKLRGRTRAKQTLPFIIHHPQPCQATQNMLHTCLLNELNFNSTPTWTISLAKAVSPCKTFRGHSRPFITSLQAAFPAFSLQVFHLLIHGFNHHLYADNSPMCTLVPKPLSPSPNQHVQLFTRNVLSVPLTCAPIPQITDWNHCHLPSPIFIVSMNDTPIYSHTGPSI